MVLFNRKSPIRIHPLLRDWVIVLGVFALGACGPCYLLYQLSGGSCGNEIFQEIYSPDNDYKVVVFQRDCGATTGFSTQISILKASQDLSNKGGNIFSMDGHPDWTDVQVKWDTDRALLISYSGPYKVFTQKETYWYFLSKVDIDYEHIE